MMKYAGEEMYYANLCCDGHVGRCIFNIDHYWFSYAIHARSIKLFHDLQIKKRTDYSALFIYLFVLNFY